MCPLVLSDICKCCLYVWQYLQRLIGLVFSCVGISLPDGALQYIFIKRGTNICIDVCTSDQQISATSCDASWIV